MPVKTRLNENYTKKRYANLYNLKNFGTFAAKTITNNRTHEESFSYLWL